MEEEVEQNEDSLDDPEEEIESDLEEETNVEEELEQLDYLEVTYTNDYVELMCQSTVLTIEQHQYCKQQEFLDISLIFLNLILGFMIGYAGIKGFFKVWN